MKRLRMLLIAAALMAGGSALASAQPMGRDGRFDHDRDRGRNFDRDRGRDRDDRRFAYDRDDRRFDRAHWRWDGYRWLHFDGRIWVY